MKIKTQSRRLVELEVKRFEKWEEIPKRQFVSLFLKG
jgi:hypothetical protein